MTTPFANAGNYWAISDQGHAMVVAAIRQHNGQRKAADGPGRRGSGYKVIGNVAVIPIWGILLPHADDIDRLFGGIGVDDIGRAVDTATTDSTVKTILYHVNSPGGSVAGIPEVAAKIRASREVKKSIAVADPYAQSGALWLSTQASEFFAPMSGEVGSLGVISQHVDISKALEAEGLKVTLFRSTELKQETHPAFALTPEAKVEEQRQIDFYYAKFLADVAKGRGVSVSKVANDYGRGRSMNTADAKAAGLIDQIASIGTVMQRLLSGQSVGGGISAAAIEARLRVLDVDEDATAKADRMVKEARAKVAGR